MIRTFFCVNTGRPQLLTSAAALCHVSRRCCVGMPPSTDLPLCLTQVEVVPSSCHGAVCASSPGARCLVCAPRVDEQKLFRVKNNKQAMTKIKTASPCFGAINIGAAMGGRGGNRGSSRERACGACVAAPAAREPALLHGGCRDARPRGQPPRLSPASLWGHLCSHHDAAPAREMVLGELFPQWDEASQSCARVREDRPELLLDQKQISPFPYHSGTIFCFYFFVTNGFVLEPNQFL